MLQQNIFLGGLHRSGTSLLHEILRSHPQISGFFNTGVPMDEGQFLQTIYLPAKEFGGPGRFGLDESSFMDERHHLVTKENSSKLFQEWSKYWDLEKEYLIEKSPPNLVRTRFLQKLLPCSLFIIILRHPIAVSYATQKWTGDSILSLLEHYFKCYERFRHDMPFLNKVYVLRYEEFVLRPTRTLDALFDWIGLESIKLDMNVLPGLNQKYFKQWESDLFSLGKNSLSEFWKINNKFENRANVLGYSMSNPETLLPVSWLGANHKTKD